METNRIFKIHLIAITLLSSIGAISAQTQQVQKTIYVDSLYGNDTTGAAERSDLPVRSLAQAVSLASAGYTIEMRPGIYSYSGFVNITFPLIIRGYGAKITTPNPVSDHKRIQISSSKVQIHGLEIDGGRTTESVSGSAAIEMSNVSDIVIKDCSIHDVINRCIFAGGTTQRLRIENCNFKNFFNAIQTYSAASDCQIVNNFFTAATSTANGSGAIKLSFSSGTGGYGYNISGNVMVNSGQMGVEVWGGQDQARIENNSITGTVFGISLDQTTSSIVANNIIKGATYIGIEMASGSNNQFMGNIIDGFVAGVATTSNGFSVSNTNSNNFRISNNRIIGCGNSIHIQTASYATISENDIIVPSTSYSGINIAGSQRIEIRDNSIQVSTLNVAPLFIDNSSGGLLEYFRIHGNHFILGNNGNAWNLIVFYFGTSGGTIQSIEITDNSFTNSSGYLTGYINTGSISKAGASGTISYSKISGNTPSVGLPAAAAGGFYNADDIDIPGKVTSAGSPVTVQVPVPASSTASGEVGQIASDINYVYVCVAPNVWKRSAIATW